jgi:hypothetical protein
MSSFNKLAIVGDSFCSDRDQPTDWPLILSSMLGVPLVGAGYPGRSWWTTRNWILQNKSTLDQNTLLIVCHTQHGRLPALNNIGINPGLLQFSKDDYNNHLKSIDPDGKLLQLVKDFYTSDLYVDEFYKWTFEAWVKELDECAPDFFKVIHIPCFSMKGSPCFNNLKNSIVATPSLTTSLREVSVKEVGQSVIGYDSRRNHLNDHNNQMLAQALCNIINNNSNKQVFEFDNMEKWDFTLRKFQIR